jgi:hypothetical protein
MLFTPNLGIKSRTKIFRCIGIWNICTGNEDWLLLIFLFVNSIHTDLQSMSIIRHICVQIATPLTSDCSFLVKFCTVSLIAMTAVS